MTKVSFDVDMELWGDYVVYATSCRKTAAEMLNLHVAETVCLYHGRIERFKKEMYDLTKRLDEEEQK